MGGMIFTKAVDISGGGLAVMNETMLPLGSKAVLELDGPVAVRYPRGGEGAYRDCNPEPATV